MKIGFFVWEYPPRIVGGLGTYAQNMAPMLVAKGHDVTLFTINPGDLLTSEVHHGVEIHRPKIIDMSDAFPLLVAKDLRSWGTGLKFFSDVFAYNLLSATKFVNELVTVKRELDLPFVYHIHSTEWGRTMGAGSMVVSDLEYCGYEHADRVITVSYPMAEDLARHGWDSRKIDVCWNGIDPEQYSLDKVSQEEISEIRTRHGIKDGEVMILFVGRLITVKGIVNLVKAMQPISEAHPEAKLVVLGSGDLEGTVMNLMKRLGIGNNVSVRFEFVPESERIAYYAACDIAVLPSLYEPFGIVSLEAMAMGKPIVVGASGVSGFRDQVIPSGKDKTGVHVDGNNACDIAWGVGSLLDDMDEAVLMGKRARKLVGRQFTWDKVADSTIDVYKDVVASRG
jgi:glycosyltransferase involved in cell wall biosynthesis